MVNIYNMSVVIKMAEEIHSSITTYINKITHILFLAKGSLRIPY